MMNYTIGGIEFTEKELMATLMLMGAYNSHTQTKNTKVIVYAVDLKTPIYWLLNDEGFLKWVKKAEQIKVIKDFDGVLSAKLIFHPIGSGEKDEHGQNIFQYLDWNFNFKTPVYVIHKVIQFYKKIVKERGWLASDKREIDDINFNILDELRRYQARYYVDRRHSVDVKAYSDKFLKEPTPKNDAKRFLVYDVMEQTPISEIKRGSASGTSQKTGRSVGVGGYDHATGKHISSDFVVVKNERVNDNSDEIHKFPLKTLYAEIENDLKTMPEIKVKGWEIRETDNSDLSSNSINTCWITIPPYEKTTLVKNEMSVYYTIPEFKVKVICPPGVRPELLQGFVYKPKNEYKTDPLQKVKSFESATPAQNYELVHFSHPDELFNENLSRKKMLSYWQENGESLFKALGLPLEEGYPYINKWVGSLEAWTNHPKSRFSKEEKILYWDFAEKGGAIAPDFMDDLKQIYQDQIEAMKKDKKAKQLSWEIDHVMGHIKIIDEYQKRNKTKTDLKGKDGEIAYATIFKNERWVIYFYNNLKAKVYGHTLSGVGNLQDLIEAIKKAGGYPELVNIWDISNLELREIIKQTSIEETQYPDFADWSLAEWEEQAAKWGGHLLTPSEVGVTSGYIKTDRVFNVKEFQQNPNILEQDPNYHTISYPYSFVGLGTNLAGLQNAGYPNPKVGDVVTYDKKKYVVRWLGPTERLRNPLNQDVSLLRIDEYGNFLRDRDLSRKEQKELSTPDEDEDDFDLEEEIDQPKPEKIKADLSKLPVPIKGNTDEIIEAFNKHYNATKHLLTELTGQEWIKLARARSVGSVNAKSILEGKFPNGKKMTSSDVTNALSEVKAAAEELEAFTKTSEGSEKKLSLEDLKASLKGAQATIKYLEGSEKSDTEAWIKGLEVAIKYYTI